MRGIVPNFPPCLNQIRLCPRLPIRGSSRNSLYSFQEGRAVVIPAGLDNQSHSHAVPVRICHWATSRCTKQEQIVSFTSHLHGNLHTPPHPCLLAIFKLKCHYHSCEDCYFLDFILPAPLPSLLPTSDTETNARRENHGWVWSPESTVIHLWLVSLLGVQCTQRLGWKSSIGNCTNSSSMYSTQTGFSDLPQPMPWNLAIKGTRAKATWSPVKSHHNPRN